MKKTLTLLSFALVVSAASFAQTTKSTAPVAIKQTPTAATAIKKDGAAMDFKFTEHNFGELQEGPKAAVDFVFTNTGNKPLILTDVKASCGCTTPEWPKEPIAPGQTSKIKVEYNTQGRPGDFTKSITITSNESDQPKMIYIKGKVNGSANPDIKIKENGPAAPGHEGHNH
jgi:hypothetical protein